ncbi:MAG: hypothetical protein PHF18_13470 [Methanosarcina sp.]|uniref:hypothetical protein n=1 Tax=Methanosarcina sp. TaxID=2213 RepID=UPI002630F993|nr:hypothetical protein [Methanosarcina sp.]MDD3247836.1 hypothetical protein [Methanosarcina sp.]
MVQNNAIYQKFPGYVFFPENNNYSEFDLLVLFLSTSEIKVPDVSNFARSIRDKFVAVLVSYREVLEQIPVWDKENKKREIEGIPYDVQGILLTIRYEAYLNSIYGLCENLSFLVKKFYSNDVLSNSFDRQKKQFLNDKQKLDESYSKILEKTDWYVEVHAIRSEATHFLTGLISTSESSGPCYSYKKAYNQRKGAPNEINIENVEDHVKEIQRKLVLFLSEYSKHFINLKFNKDKTVRVICLRTDDGNELFYSITLNDYLNKRPRKCDTLEFDCPHKEKCKFI